MHRLAFIVVCCLLGQTVSQYTFYVLLEQFSAGSGFLDNGQRCSMFWWTPNVQCDLDIQLCVEPFSGTTDTNMNNCNQPGTSGAFVQLNVTRNKNNIIFERGWYGGWKNPLAILAPGSAFLGFQVKVKVNHYGDDNNIYCKGRNYWVVFNLGELGGPADYPN